MFSQKLPNFEYREQQQLMAGVVQKALNSSQKVIIEAQTGIGKTLAYLAPIVQMIDQFDQPVVVSTATINLQEQICEKDLPQLLKVMGREDLRVELAKGRSNYLCYNKISHINVIQEDFNFVDQEQDEWHRLVRWGQETSTGDLAECPFCPSHYVWQKVACNSETCVKKDCQYANHCFMYNARQRLKDAHIIVTNHHFLLSDAQLRNEDAGLLPEYSALIIDEAHKIMDAASSCLSISITLADMEAIAQSAQKWATLLSAQGQMQLEELGQQCLDQAKIMFEDDLSGLLGRQDMVDFKTTVFDGDPLKNTLEAIALTIEEDVQRMGDEELLEEATIKWLLQRCRRLANDLAFYFQRCRSVCLLVRALKSSGLFTRTSGRNFFGP